ARRLTLVPFTRLFRSNAVAFFGIAYWDQTIVVWYALLAMIPIAATSGRRASTPGWVAGSESASLVPLFGDEPQFSEVAPDASDRSEEHTSELQSPDHL